MSTKTASEAVTRDIRVVVRPRYEPDHSHPQEKRFIFSYHVTITNESPSAVKLLSRHWIVINGEGDREDVRGPGVVGFTPTLAPGESFSYTSYCPLNTDFGTMEGSYRLEDEGGNEFDVAIGRFYLAANDSP